MNQTQEFSTIETNRKTVNRDLNTISDSYKYLCIYPRILNNIPILFKLGLT